MTNETLFDTEIETAFTAQDVLSAIHEARGWDEYSSYNEWTDWTKYNAAGETYAEKYQNPVMLTLGDAEYEVKLVEETGGPDEGSNASVVIQVGTQFFRKEGYYASHYGHDWDGSFEEVHPKVKTITVYI